MNFEIKIDNTGNVAYGAQAQQSQQQPGFVGPPSSMSAYQPSNQYTNPGAVGPSMYELVGASQGRRDALKDYAGAQERKKYEEEYRATWKEVQTAADQAKEDAQKLARAHADRLEAMRELHKADTAEMQARRGFEAEVVERHRRLEVMKERNRIDSAEMEASRDFQEEVLLRHRRLEVMRERHRIDSAEMEASRNFQEEVILRHRRLEVMRERHRLDSAEMQASRDVEEELLLRSRRLEVMRERHRQDSAAAEAGRNFQEEVTLRHRRLEVLKERHKIDTAAMEASRAWEEEKLEHDRRMEVLRERRKIDEAASEEARRALEIEKEDRQWRQRVHEERRKQDPGRAAAEDMGAIGSVLGGGGGGGGAMGSVGRMFGQAPALAQGLEGATAGAGIAGAAGALGPLLAIGQEYVKLKQSAVDSTVGMIKGVTGTAGSITRNEFMGPALGAAKGMADMADYIPVVGESFSMLAKVGVGAVEAVAALQDQFIQLGEKLKPFSAAITEAQVAADVRRMKGDVREAEELGPMIARLVDAQSRTSESLREISGPIKKGFGEASTIVQQLIADTVENWAGRLERWGIIAFLNDNVDGIALALRRLLSLKDVEQDGTLDDMIVGALNNLRRDQMLRGPDPGRGEVPGGGRLGGGGF